MATFDVECFQDEYHDILKYAAHVGIKRAPRGTLTYDLGPTTIVLHDLNQPVLPLYTGRKISRTVAALEALQIIGGVSTPELLIAASPRFESFMEPDPVTGEPSYFHGAYGRRVGTQVFAAIHKLKNDPDTRQAIITLWDPTMDNLSMKRDYPCTVALGLSIVNDRLAMNVLMRSNDVWLGLPNDVFVFTQLQWTIAHALNVSPGMYVHTAWSLHLYEYDMYKVDAVTEARKHEYQPTGLICDSYGTAASVAHKLLNGLHGDAIPLSVKEEGEQNDWLEWYRDAISSVVG